MRHEIGSPGHVQTGRAEQQQQRRGDDGEVDAIHGRQPRMAIGSERFALITAAPGGQRPMTPANCDNDWGPGVRAALDARGAWIQSRFAANVPGANVCAAGRLALR